MPYMFQDLHRGLSQATIADKIIVSGFWVGNYYTVVAQDSQGNVIEVETITDGL